jgi:ABC-type cobalamin/Fe3+-siderophores transport systems, ATPase components
MVVLNVNNIDCYYDSTKIIENASFVIKTGDFVGILGPNGSGKSTLLKSISHTLKPQKGTVLLDNKDIYELTSVDVAKKMAVVSQGTTIAFSFTVLDTVLMGRSPHLSRFAMESEKDVAIAKRSMAYTGTLHLAKRLITELSGGERQRVLISRALTQEPEVLLLDEPTTYLDVSNQLEIMDVLKTLCNEKKLLVLGIFHDFNLAARYCDSIIMLKNGKIFAAGKSEDVLTSDNLKTAFNIDTIVTRNPLTKSIYAIPLSTKHDLPSRNLFVHLICGAGTGSSLMKLLKDDGYNVSAGVLNLFDTDQETAKFLRIPSATEAPLSPISELAFNENMRLINKADYIVLTSFPFGLGNLRNLDAAEFAVERKKPTFIIAETPIELRDFTQGKAKKKLLTLQNKGAVIVKDEPSLMAAIANLPKQIVPESSPAVQTIQTAPTSEVL